MTSGGGSGRRLEQEWQWHRERAVARAGQGCAGVQAGLSGAVNMAAPGMGAVDSGSGSKRLGKIRARDCWGGKKMK